MIQDFTHLFARDIQKVISEIERFNKDENLWI